MNKLGQAGPIGALILFILFILIWFIWLGGSINEITSQAADSAELTGVVAFGLKSFNLWVSIFLMLGLVGFIYFLRGSG